MIPTVIEAVIGLSASDLANFATASLDLGRILTIVTENQGGRGVNLRFYQEYLVRNPQQVMADAIRAYRAAVYYADMGNVLNRLAATADIPRNLARFQPDTAGHLGRSENYSYQVNFTIEFAQGDFLQRGIRVYSAGPLSPVDVAAAAFDKLMREFAVKSRAISEGGSKADYYSVSYELTDFIAYQ